MNMNIVRDNIKERQYRLLIRNLRKQDEKNNEKIIIKKVNSHKLVVKQKGQYIIGYHKGYYNTIEQTYDKMTIYAKDNNLVIGSNSYTKEILDVLTSNSKEEYLIEIVIELK